MPPLPFNVLVNAIRAASRPAQSVLGTFRLNVDSVDYAVPAGNTYGTGTISVDGPGAVLRLSMGVSRFSGVAPLYVNFDYNNTTSTVSTNPAHESYFMTDFGDPGSGTWANGVQSAGLTSKNSGIGPVTGHVFETPGTYTVTGVGIDGAGNVSSRTATITVQDPNTVYAGAATVCISHSGNFTGAPSGATQVNTAGNTDMYAAWNTYKGSNKRILFCKANSWIASATIDAAGLSNMIVGGYGTGVAHTFSTGTTLVSLTPAKGISRTLQGGGATDVRFCEFRINASAMSDGVGCTSGNGYQVTWSKIEVRGATESFANYPNSGFNNLYKHEQSCYYECQSTDLYGYAFIDCPLFTGASGAVGTPGIFTATAHPFKEYDKVRLVGTAPGGLSTGVDYFISATNLTANTFSLCSTRSTAAPLAISSGGTCDVTAMTVNGGVSGFITMTNGGIMGCYFDNGNHGEQTLRMVYLKSSHISNNYIARPNQSKNIVKMQSRGYNNIIGVSNGYSEKVLFSGNILDVRGGYSFNDVIPNNGRVATMVGDCFIVTGYGNAGEGVDERLQNVIVENNITYSCRGTGKDYPSFIAVGCRNFTVRNNIADLSFGDRTTAFISGYSSHVHFASVSTSSPEQTVGVRIYNNTLYTNLSNPASIYFVRFGDNPTYTDADQTAIKNNLWYTPFYTGAFKTAYYNQNGACTNIDATNNSDTVATDSTVNPNFVATPPVALTDWRPNTGSYAINTGTTLPVLRDFNNASRVGGTYDLGAVLP